eukprot:8916118-Pyramimonas_sp.AAC.1
MASPPAGTPSPGIGARTRSAALAAAAAAASVALASRRCCSTLVACSSSDACRARSIPIEPSTSPR